MSKLEEFFKSSLLEELLLARSDEFESILLKLSKKSEENSYTIEQELYNELEKYISDEKSLEKVRKKLEKYEEHLLDEYDVSIRRLYKLGFIDGYNFKREIQDVIKEDKKKK